MSPRSLAVGLAALVAGPAIALAQSRPIPADARYIDATAFGADGSDLLDDTAALNAALDAARPPGASAIPVYLPDGTYYVSDTVLYSESRVTLAGESEAGTIIRLIDNAPGYQDPMNPKRVVSTRESGGFSANQFRVSLYDITIDTGAGNPGAEGLLYHNNNQGTVSRVTIRSSDPARVGTVGLRMTGSDKGPGMIRDVTIDGFDIGIAMGGTEYSMVLEGITLTNQNVAAIQNVWNIMTFRDLTSTNTVPVLLHDQNTQNNFSWGMVTILDGVLNGAPGTAALISDSSLYLRNVTSTGYDALVRQDGVDLPFTEILGEWTSDRPQSVFRSAPAMLNLPIEDVPSVPWDDPAAAPGSPGGWWANAEGFGADGTDNAGLDDAAGIQAAIDSGATTVYLPAGRYDVGQTILLRGSVRRVILCESVVDLIEPLASAGSPVFATDPSNLGPVVIERGDINSSPNGSSIGHTTAGTLVIRNVTGATTNASGFGGRLFVEDAVSGPHHISGSKQGWYRQLNPENAGTKVINDGAEAVIIGLKTEKQGTPIETRSGGSTELIGGLIYPVQTLPLDQPMFVNHESSFSAIIGESSFSGDSNHVVVVEETRSGATRRLFDNELPGRVGFFRGVRMAFYAGADTGEPDPTDPIAAYPMDEGAGTLIPDDTGNNNDGMTDGGPAWVAGLFGNALAFDGIDDDATLPQGLVNTDAGAVSVWINSSFAYTATGHIFYFTATTDGNANGGGSQNEAHLSFNAGGALSLFIEGGTSDLVLTSTGPWNDGAWHHVVASWDIDGYCDLYIDGRRADWSPSPGHTRFDTNAGRVRLGRPNADTRYFNGLMDDLRVFDRPVSHAEAIDLYVEGVGFTNYPPNVDAGIAQVIQEPSFSRGLNGQAVDDNQPFGPPTVEWTVVGGPAGVTFDDASSPTAVASYPQAGSYTLQLEISDGVLARSDTVVADVYDPLPAPWDNNDQGGVGALGWAVAIEADEFEVNGSGSNIAGNPAQGGDSFHYVFQPTAQTGSVNFLARVTSVENTNPDARAGVMYRSAEGGTNANAFVYVTPENGVGFTARSGSGGGTATVETAPGIGAPVWLRLERVSTNAFRGYYSTNGTVWTELANEEPPTPTTVNMGGGPKLVGMAVTARSNGDICTAMFDNVRLAPPDVACDGDVNLDKTIDIFDFAELAANFGTSQPFGVGGDVDYDGDVDVFDFSTLAAAFGQSCP